MPNFYFRDQKSQRNNFFRIVVIAETRRSANLGRNRKLFCFYRMSLSFILVLSQNRAFTPGHGKLHQFACEKKLMIARSHVFLFASLKQKKIAAFDCN